jgi:hypothetical protein
MRYPAQAMYDQLEDTLTSITIQLRSAIEADASMPPRVNGKMNGASGPLGTTVTVSLPIPQAP